MTALEALARPRFLIGGWPWRSAAYLVTTLPSTVLASLGLFLPATPLVLALLVVRGGGISRFGMAAALVLIGLLACGVCWPLLALPLAEVERRRLLIADVRPARSGHRLPARPGIGGWAATRWREAATWRAVVHAFLLATVIPLTHLCVLVVLVQTAALVVSPVLVTAVDGPLAIGPTRVTTVEQTLPYAAAGLALLVLMPYLLGVAAGAQALLTRLLLDGAPAQRLRTELVEVARSRARLVDAHETALRRIERDLHDGAQQRLVSLTLQLGLARLDLPAGQPATQAVADAHEQAKQLMAELRELIRGIHPRVLTDRGLAAAIAELADQSTIPVKLTVDVPVRLTDHLEASAYFVVAEALTNIAKHSGAGDATVDVVARADFLTVRVHDNGHGGADPGAGSGLTGLADRVAALDGTVRLSSPAGGPTVLHVEFPLTRGTMAGRPEREDR
jgi:signal transduction histidine kinase